jgi:glutathione peroxidase
MTAIYDFSANRLNGELQELSDYCGKALLVVNTASKCGFTPQFEGLEALYKKYQPKGLEVLGFPCNQFKQQEPGEAAEIAEFCQANYGVSFPMFAKIDVKGPGAHPLYQFLCSAAPGILGSKAIKWNFTKFLVSPEGAVIKRYATATKPQKIAADIELALPG